MDWWVAVRAEHRDNGGAPEAFRMDGRLRRAIFDQGDKEKMEEGVKKGETHAPVLPAEVLSLAGLALGPGARPLILDGTLGEAGHARLLLRRFPEAGVIGFDRDPEMLERATRFCRDAGVPVRLWSGGRPLPGQLEAVRGPFSGAPERLGPAELAFGFILLDLGVSMYHFRNAGRGFSYGDDSLDMRLDPDLERTAADVVNRLPERGLVQIFSELGEERFSKRIARAIVEHRPIGGAVTLASIVAAAVPRRPGARIHPATRVFQALRMYVNDELGELGRALGVLPGLLAPGGVMCVISFHSLEDRAVKHAFRSLSGRPIAGGGRYASEFHILTRRPIEASEEETRDNPASRSAKLRAIQRAPVDIGVEPGAGQAG